MALFNCHMKRCESFLYHVCQGGNVDMHDINDDVAEWNIFHSCVDKLWMGGKPEKFDRIQGSLLNNSSI